MNANLAKLPRDGLAAETSTELWSRPSRARGRSPRRKGLAAALARTRAVLPPVTVLDWQEDRIVGDAVDGGWSGLVIDSEFDDDHVTAIAVAQAVAMSRSIHEEESDW